MKIARYTHASQYRVVPAGTKKQRPHNDSECDKAEQCFCVQTVHDSSSGSLQTTVLTGYSSIHAFYVRVADNLRSIGRYKDMFASVPATAHKVSVEESGSFPGHGVAYFIRSQIKVRVTFTPSPVVVLNVMVSWSPEIMK